MNINALKVNWYSIASYIDKGTVYNVTKVTIYVTISVYRIQKKSKKDTWRTVYHTYT